MDSAQCPAKMPNTKEKEKQKKRYKYTTLQVYRNNNPNTLDQLSTSFERKKKMYPGLSDTTSRNPTPRSSRGVCVYLLHNSHHMSAIYDLQDHARRNTIQRKDEKRTRKRHFCQIKACHGSPSSAAVVGRKRAETTLTSVDKTGVIK